MKVLWNDQILDTDDATANKDGSFTWQDVGASLTYFPETGQLVCLDNYFLAKTVLPIIYRKVKV